MFKTLFRPARLAAVAAAVFTLSCLSAHADSVDPTITYTFGGSNNDFSGTLFFDPVTNTMTGSVVFSSGGNTFTFQGSDFYATKNQEPNGNFTYIDFMNADTDTLTIAFFSNAEAVDGNVTQYLLCSDANPCTYTSPGDTVTVKSNENGFFNDAGGYMDATLTVPAQTPEPSSLALLGTGILGVADTVRRRFTRA